MDVVIVVVADNVDLASNFCEFDHPGMLSSLNGASLVPPATRK